MTSENWHRIEALFDQAVELPVDEREAFLRRECAGDDDLLDRVWRLVESDSEATEAGPGGALSGSLLARLSETEESDALPVERLGAYRLVKEIGRGGMGRVYLARRDDETFSRDVAIKWLHSPIAGEQAKRRLRLERQILANLDHPSIAKLLDAGATDAGMPYFVMEYVEGVAIDRYCDSQRLNVEARIELFLKVCDAVTEAHRNLIVHRDLKPSNILVTAEGEPKLLDFGIAKLLDPESAGIEAGVTEGWMRVLTPGYASPEQVRGEQITTAADVYSLGVLLYKLLVGRPPFDFKDSSLEEISRHLETTEAPRASSEASAGAEERDSQERADLRLATPSELASRLRGDLDSILAKALRSDATRRYQSVEQLASDLRRQRDGFPVRARAGTLSYRATKFIGRYRWPLTLAASILVLLVGFSVSLAFLSLDLQRERDDKDEVIRFIVELFESADPGRTAGESLTVIDVLDSTGDRLDRLGGQPRVESTLSTVLGRLYSSLGSAEKASALFGRSLEIESELHGEESVEASLARSQFGEVLLEAGDAEASAAAGQRAISSLRRESVPDAVMVAPINRLVTTLCQQEDYEQASGLASEVLMLAQREMGERCERGFSDPYGTDVDGCLQLARSLINRGQVARKYDDQETAAELFARAFEIQTSLLPPLHPDIADLRTVRAAVAKQLGRREEALAIYDDVLAVQRELYDGDHPAIARTLSLISTLQRQLGRVEESLVTQVDYVDMLGRTSGITHSWTIWSELQLANRLIQLGRPQRAAARIEPHLELWRSLSLGASCWVVADIEGSLGAAWAELGRREEGGRLIEQSFWTVHRELGHQESERALRQLQEALRRLVEFTESEGDVDRAAGLRSGVARVGGGSGG
ncbi:MAG: serine/threonine-protein kinase [Acidobacteriota bacterium]